MLDHRGNFKNSGLILREKEIQILLWKRLQSSSPMCKFKVYQTKKIVQAVLPGLITWHHYCRKICVRICDFWFILTILLCLLFLFSLLVMMFVYPVLFCSSVFPLCHLFVDHFLSFSVFSPALFSMPGLSPSTAADTSLINPSLHSCSAFYSSGEHCVFSHHVLFSLYLLKSLSAYLNQIFKVFFKVTTAFSFSFFLFFFKKTIFSLCFIKLFVSVPGSYLMAASHMKTKQTKSRRGHKRLQS